MSEEEKQQKPIKIILVGSGGVGKTTLINTFFDQDFEGETQPTVAPAFCNATVKTSDQTDVELHIWDTAGQERFQSVGTMFYRESNIALVCFDFEQKSTIASWVERVRANAPSECIIFLVLTKEDMLDSEQVSEILSESDQMLKDYGAKEFYMTSSSTGKGVKQLFSACAECYNEIYCSNTPDVVPIEAQPHQSPSSKCKC